jgi:tetratricopeptide (TPR) repeat protein
VYLVLPLLVAFLAGAVVFQMALDQQWMELRSQPPPRDYVLPGSVLRSLSVGQNGLLADIYWTRAVQYFGQQRLAKSRDFSLLSSYINTAVELDPQLVVAYYVGAFFLSTPAPSGAGRPDLAVDLLQRGIKANPDYWRFWHHLGFTYYWELGDYDKAAAAYLEGAKNPKARSFMKAMAAAIAAKGGNRATSRLIWEQIYESTTDETIRASAQRNLMLLTVADDLEGLQRATAEFHRRNGRWPVSFREMIAAGILRREPEDPLHVPYLLQAEGRVITNPESRLSHDYTPAPSHVAASRGEPAANPQN